MLSEKSLAIIRQSSGHLNKPVRLVLFTTDMACAACPEALELVRAIKTQVNRIALETYDIVMDRDMSEQYGIKQAPALVVQGGEGQAVTFYGSLEDVFLEILMETIRSLADTKVWFPENIRRALKHLVHNVKLRVFVENDCQMCRPVAETAIGLAMESRLIDADIIVASDFPELIKRHKITKLPTTIFGENLFMEGQVAESEFLEMIFQAEGIKPAPDRRCLVCGNPSPDIVCSQCKTKIQAEALEHKLNSEKIRQRESS
jgi:hypothetical protein